MFAGGAGHRRAGHPCACTRRVTASGTPIAISRSRSPFPFGEREGTDGGISIFYQPIGVLLQLVAVRNNFFVIQIGGGRVVHRRSRFRGLGRPGRRCASPGHTSRSWLPPIGLANTWSFSFRQKRNPGVVLSLFSLLIEGRVHSRLLVSGCVWSWLGNRSKYPPNNQPRTHLFVPKPPCRF